MMAVFIAILGASLWLESRSPLSAALRANQPWLCRVSFRGPAGGLTGPFLAIYQPGRRLADLVYAPQPRDPRKAVDLTADLPVTAGPEGLPQLVVDAQLSQEDEAPLAAENWILDRTQGLGGWSFLARELRHLKPSAGTLDLALLAVELHRMRPENMRAAWLPETEGQRRFFFGNVFAPPSDTRGGGRAIAVEVLNATRKAGIASTATDILRSNGADVVNVGNAPSPRERTVIYDRTGRAENAESVRGYLGCREARVVTQISPKKLVDVTVVLAEDCASPEKRGVKWNWLRF